MLFQIAGNGCPIIAAVFRHINAHGIVIGEHGQKFISIARIHSDAVDISTAIPLYAIAGKGYRRGLALMGIIQTIHRAGKGAIIQASRLSRRHGESRNVKIRLDILQFAPIHISRLWRENIGNGGQIRIAPQFFTRRQIHDLGIMRVEQHRIHPQTHADG